MQKTLDNTPLCVAATLLSGGLSTRMGKDKATLHPYGEAKPNLLARTHAILGNHFSTIWVSCAKGKARHGYDCIFDEYHEIGPISGIYAGLRAAKHAGLEAILVLPCDLPLMSDSIIQILLKTRHEHRAATQGPYNLMTTFLHEKTGNIEALIAIYEVEALELFASGIAGGLRAPRMIIPDNLRTYIPYPDDLAQFFFNLNTAEELKQFQEKYAT